MHTYMESPVTRARELRRNDLLEDAARSRLAAQFEHQHTGAPAARLVSTWFSRVAEVMAGLTRKRHGGSRTPVGEVNSAA
jgi:hypothetical protein